MSTSASENIRVALVGMHFRPPAKQVLGQLPAGTELLLEAEPENGYDPKAIKVLVQLNEAFRVDDFPGLDAALEGTGFTVDDLIVDAYRADIGGYAPMHLGYLADSDGKATRGRSGNREAKELMDHGPVLARLVFDADGKPAVEIRPRKAAEETRPGKAAEESSLDDQGLGDDWTE